MDKRLPKLLNPPDPDLGMTGEVEMLAGYIAHDLKNLLTIVAGYAELLLEDAYEPADLREYAQEMRSATARAVRLVTQVLDTRWKALANAEATNLNEAIVTLLKSLRGRFGAGIAVSTKLDHSLPPIAADPAQIHRVLLNLLLNACDAMSNGGRLTVETSAKPDILGSGRSDYAMVSIEDTGSGMDADTKRRIFEPYFTTKGRNGTGLGLTSVQRIVEDAGGKIAVDSAPGEGTKFRVYLPHVRLTTGARVSTAAIMGGICQFAPRPSDPATCDRISPGRNGLRRTLQRGA
jgi:signal transduction histidine kinase